MGSTEWIGCAEKKREHRPDEDRGTARLARVTYSYSPPMLGAIANEATNS